MRTPTESWERKDPDSTLNPGEFRDFSSVHYPETRNTAKRRCNTHGAGRGGWTQVDFALWPWATYSTDATTASLDVRWQPPQKITHVPPPYQLPVDTVTGWLRGAYLGDNLQPCLIRKRQECSSCVTNNPRWPGVFSLGPNHTHVALRLVQPIQRVRNSILVSVLILSDLQLIIGLEMEFH